MGIIRQLPPSVINQIAAGEVVERPASVIKELLENSIDAGATRIDVTVERGGKDLVRIADNGKGMSAEDLPLAFLPHATSKLSSAEDLFQISTLGFRGEALAAIAEVSKVRCQTRQVGSSDGHELAIDCGVASPIRECGGPEGTVIEVRNLFANTPVRRTFLKSDSTEAAHVAEMFSRVALAHPTIRMTFRSSGKLVHDLPPATGIKERIATFFGQELADSLLWVESQMDPIHIWGYVAHPSQSRSSAKGQFLFVGGRYVRDRSLGHALAEAYRGLLMVGRLPVAFLHLDLPPDQVDVNVHPTKVEVRFRDSPRIYSQLLATVRKTFLASDLHSKLQAPADQVDRSVTTFRPAETPVPSPQPQSQSHFALEERPPDRQSVANWFTPPNSLPKFQSFPTPGYAGGPPEPEWARKLPDVVASPNSVPFDEFANETSETTAQPQLQPQPADAPTPAQTFEGPKVVDSVGISSFPPRALQVHDSYLIAETNEGMMVIDQHALHERILYEELRERVQRGSVESQRLLVPETVDLSAAEAAAVLEQKEVLQSLGLEIEPFGGDTVAVTTTPTMLSQTSPSRLLRDLAEHLRSSPLPPTRDAILAELLHMIACKAAVKAGQRLTPDEVAALLERRHLVSDSHHCPHGRPTALVFTKSELERQFGRI